MGEIRRLKDLRLKLHSYGPVLHPPSLENTIEILSPERPAPMLETMKFVRKKFDIDAVQVTAANMEEIAKWVDGEIRTDTLGQYVKVRVHRPLNDRQTKAYVGDWVLYAGTGYKVYTPKAFKDSFEQVSGESVMIDTDKATKRNKNEDSEIVAVVEGDVVVPKRIPKKRAAAQ